MENDREKRISDLKTMIDGDMCVIVSQMDYVKKCTTLFKDSYATMADEIHDSLNIINNFKNEIFAYEKALNALGVQYLTKDQIDCMNNFR